MSHLYTNRFVVSHSLLQFILSRYVDHGPGQVRFRLNSFGKPALEPDCGGEAIRFSRPHSRGLAPYAVCIGREVDVDVECYVKTGITYPLRNSSSLVANWQRCAPRQRRHACAHSTIAGRERRPMSKFVMRDKDRLYRINTSLRRYSI